MPMATTVPFSPSADVSQTGHIDFVNMNCTFQVPSPDNPRVVQLGASHNSISPGPYLSITEQPKNKWRYRYQSEKGSHGPLQGCTSGTGRKTFPTIKVVNLPERPEISVKASLWTDEQVPVLHVHRLCGPTCGIDGSCTVKVNEDGVAVFQELHILFVAKKDVPTILAQRIQREQNNKMDKKLLKKITDEKAKTMNLNSVKICFEAFYINRENGESVPICSSVFSDPVSNLKSPKCGDLKICRISRVAGSVRGEDEVYLFCSKIDKKEIRVRFFEPNSDWEDFGKFTEADVHCQVALVFRTPPYYCQDIGGEVKVLFQLQRRNGETSEPKEFSYIPDDERISKKRKKNYVNEQFGESGGYVNQNFGVQDYNLAVQNQNPLIGFESISDSSLGNSSTFDECGDEQLDLMSLLKDLDSLEENPISQPLFASSPFDLEDKESTFLNYPKDPLLSEVNVPLPQWNIPNDYDTNRFKTDSAVSNIKQLENLESKSLSQKDDLNVKSEEVEQAFNKLFISNDSRTVNENSGTCSSGIEQQNETKEPNAEDRQNSASVFQMEESLPRVVSNSSLKKLWCSLFLAVKKGNLFDLLKNLPQLIIFSDKNQNTLLHLAVSQELQCEFITESLLKIFEEARFALVNSANKDWKTPLHIAIEAEKPSVVRLLLKYGADPTIIDKRGFSSYHLAIHMKSRVCLAELLQKMNYKSPPKTPCLDTTDHNGLAPLHHAVRNEVVECIELLCDDGADINVISKKDGRTPLHYAAFQDHKVTSILLAQKSIDINVQDYGGNTPLHLASSSKNSEVVRLLVLHGADSSLSNYESIGVTPYNFAGGNVEIRKILASSHTFRKFEPDTNSGGATAASCGSEILSQDDDVYRSENHGKRRELQCKYEAYSCPKPEYTSTTQDDSGYISGKLPLLSEDLVQKLSLLLDPPSDLWRTLMLFTIMDEDFEQNIHKLTSSPTKAILAAFLNNGGTINGLVDALAAAELHEAMETVIQHVDDCSSN